MVLYHNPDPNPIPDPDPNPNPNLNLFYARGFFEPIATNCPRISNVEWKRSSQHNNNHPQQDSRRQTFHSTVVLAIPDRQDDIRNADLQDMPELIDFM